jgi:hypothetical protein
LQAQLVRVQDLGAVQAEDDLGSMLTFKNIAANIGIF